MKLWANVRPGGIYIYANVVSYVFPYRYRYMSILLLIMVVVFFGTTVSHPLCHTSSGHQSDGFWAQGWATR